MRDKTKKAVRKTRKYTAVLKFSFKLKGQIILGAGDVKVSVIKKFKLVVLFFSVELKLNIANVCVCVCFFFSNKERCIGPTGDPIQ